MKKCLLLAALLVVSLINTKAQQALFNVSVPSDTVCVKQLISLTSNVTGSTYYWGFCSGYLSNEPTGVNLGSSFSFHDPSDIDVVRDVDSSYYGFVLNAGTNELLRLNFGNSLANTPKVTNFGTFNNVMPDSPACLYIVRDTIYNNSYVFIAGGSSAGNSTLARVDFYGSLNSNTPSIINFGNLYNKFNRPRGLFVAYDPNQTRWYGYCLNNGTNSFLRIDFDNNISNTPLVTDIGNPGNTLGNPTDMAGQLDNGTWYFFVVNGNNPTGSNGNTMARIDFGTTLNNLSPIGNALTLNGDPLTNPSSITLVADCGGYHAYITEKDSNVLTRIDMSNIAGTGTPGGYFSQSLKNVGQLDSPTAISRIIRDYDNLYGFVTNQMDSSLTRITFGNCYNASIPSSSSKTPPEFYYTNNDTIPQVYNIYFAVDEGLPDQRVACQTITVLPYPKMLLFPTDTSICQGDTIGMRVIVGNAITYRWSPIYNISDSIGNSITAWPRYSLKYKLEIPFADGCVVDTFVNVHVTQVVADAGPDRQISDGAKTILGGPNTSMGSGYTYSWTPNEFIDNVTSPNPTANPAYDFTYYLNVSIYLNDSVTCQANDTVVVHVGCDDIHLPNAFMPNSSNSLTNHFGILNKEIVKLDYFRIFDRWGNKVFETTDPTQGWDGMENNNPAEIGVYVWEIQGYCTNNGKRYTKTGNVTLLR